MPRIKIIAPQKTIATVSIPIRIGDINYGNHVGNDSFVSIIHEARLQWLQQNNFSELNIDGAALIMSGIAVEFKKEAFYGDTLKIKISAGEITTFGFELFYQLTTNRNNSIIVIAIAKTDMVCFDYTTKKIMPLPEALKRVLNKVEN